MKMGWNCLWLMHWHVTETRAKWHVTFCCFQVGWFLAHLKKASTNVRLYTFESQSGVNSCTFEAGFNKCQIVLFWVSRWVFSCTLQNSWPWHVKFLWDVCMHAACRFRHKKFNKFSSPNFCAACQSCMQCAQKLMRGYQTLTLCHFFLWKGGSIW